MLPGDLQHRFDRRVRPQVDDIECGAAQDVGEHRERELMRVSGHAPEEHGAPAAAPAHEARRDSADDATSGGRHAVLLGDRQRAAFPPRADLAQDRCQELDVDVGRRRARDECLLGHRPCAGVVAGKQARTQALAVRTPLRRPLTG